MGISGNSREFKKLTMSKAVIKVMDSLDIGREFNARQFKYWFDGVYGDNGMYIDTVMRRVREYCSNRYEYDKKEKLYRKIA